MLTPLRGALAATVFLAPVVAGADTVLSTKGEERLTAYITGYSYWDNSPPGSAAIAHTGMRDAAGGVGTYDDPITIAVGWQGRNWDYAPGTRMYLEDLRRYVVVEDLCGACKNDKNGLPRLDIYVGGEDTSAKAARHCTYRITGTQPIIINPAPIYPVDEGPVTRSCAES